MQFLASRTKHSEANELNCANEFLLGYPLQPARHCKDHPSLQHGHMLMGARGPGQQIIIAEGRTMKDWKGIKWA